MGHFTRGFARGCWQQELETTLLREGKIENPVSNLRGKAKDYSVHYWESFQNLLLRMKRAGYCFRLELGPHGGYSRAQWHITVRPETKNEN